MSEVYVTPSISLFFNIVQLRNQTVDLGLKSVSWCQYDGNLVFAE